jgi:hypothetical protein
LASLGAMPNQLPLSPAATDCHNLVGSLQVDAFDRDSCTESLRHERARQVHLQHGQEADALFRLTIRVDDGFFNEPVEPRFAESARCGLLRRSRQSWLHLTPSYSVKQHHTTRLAIDPVQRMV